MLVISYRGFLVRVLEGDGVRVVYTWKDDEFYDRLGDG